MGEKKMRTLTMIFFIFLTTNVFCSEFTDKMPGYLDKISKIKEKDKADLKGKFTEIIKEISALKYNDKEEEETMMYLTTLAETCTLNGDYDRSNEYYTKVIALVPFATFYRLMVENMLLKGDKDAANKIVDAFTKKAEEIKDPEDRKRQIAEVKKAFENVKAATTSPTK
jgi:hypothetical protein